MFKHDCSKHGHRFEARYDEMPPEDMRIGKSTAGAMVQVIRAMTKKVYVHDICVRCGEISKATPESDR